MRIPLKHMALAAIAMTMFLTAAVRAADAPSIPDRVAAIKPGEWVLMQHVSADGTTETSKATVTAVEGDTITISHEQFDAEGASLGATGRGMNAAEIRERIADLSKRATSITAETLVVKEKELPVVSIQWTADTQDASGRAHEFKVWVSDRIPVTGLAKFWSSDTNIPQAEILDYGFGE